MKQIVVTLHVVCTDEAYDDLIEEAQQDGYDDPLAWFTHQMQSEFNEEPGITAEVKAIQATPVEIQT